MYDLAVYIGRFQPFHNGHADIVKSISRHAKKVLIIIGSIDAPRTAKNPFTFEERKAMIKKTVHVRYLQISGVLDYTYDNTRWVKAVSEIVKANSKPEDKIAIAGYNRDESSAYLNYFPQWDSLAMHEYKHYGDPVNATELRALYFNEQVGYMQNYMPPASFGFMLEFKTHKEYKILQEEFDYIQKYKHDWKTPFPSVFVTVDSLVLQSGHILMIRRKNAPGKDLWAMPGGYIDVDETIETSMLRELKEETNIHLQDEVLKRAIEEVKIFDKPNRAQRGRIITHVHLLKLDDSKPLPKVKGCDDAIEAKWIPIGDFFQMRKQTFSDHWHIIESMI
ncbi:MAG: bifunctional nicotinamide-nucleotide adenylyltransferase/Nudix hydroxylase [Desulfobacteraceae bacterium]|nr:bifunctional nicotinamide-nucleotide adenylyltransferase/Nudix hydroxylase [Desulfobacteraceae bacterium]